MSFPLPLRIAQKLPVRNSWELINIKLPIPLPILFYFELFREVLANTLYSNSDTQTWKTWNSQNFTKKENTPNLSGHHSREPFAREFRQWIVNITVILWIRRSRCWKSPRMKANKKTCGNSMWTEKGEWWPLSSEFLDTLGRENRRKSSLRTSAAGKTKGQQLKGKIVSYFFTLFHTFSEFFPQDFPP